MHRVSTNRQKHPALSRSETQARLALAAAIMRLDESDGPAIAEQAAVERRMWSYAAALADLVRGESSSSGGGDLR